MSQTEMTQQERLTELRRKAQAALPGYAPESAASAPPGDRERAQIGRAFDRLQRLLEDLDAAGELLRDLAALKVRAVTG